MKRATLVKTFVLAIYITFIISSCVACNGKQFSAQEIKQGFIMENKTAKESEEIGRKPAVEEKSKACLSGTITIAGSTAMEKFSNVLAESFMTAYPDITVNVEFTGSSAGIEAVLSGRADIGNASRNLREEELAEGAVENVIAIDGIAVITNPTNSITELTTEQLIDIYTGRIRNWCEAGGTDEAIVVVGREIGSGTRSAFEEVLGVEDVCRYANELDSSGAVMARVAAISGAIGYVTLDIPDNTVRVLALDGTMPAQEQILNGSYRLNQPFVMVTDGMISEQSEMVQELFTYIRSEEGKRLIESVGLIIPTRNN